MVSKFIQIVLLASVKYFLTIPYTILIGMDYKTAVIAIVTGGIGGFLFFYYLLKPLMRITNVIKPLICRIVPEYLKKRYSVFCARWISSKKRVYFSRRCRLIVRIKRSFGMWGLIVTTPVLLSIPLGAFLARRYYSHQRRIVLYMMGSIMGWGILLSAFLRLFPGIM
jgi:hypothetical protein